MSMNIAKRLVLLVFMLLCATGLKAQQCKVDVVYLHNGSIIKGELIELKVGESVKVQTVGGSIFVFSMDEVDKIIREDQSDGRLQGMNSTSQSREVQNNTQLRDNNTQNQDGIDDSDRSGMQNTQPNNPQRNLGVNPGTSQVLGILIPGGGHIYSGKTVTGLALLGISAGAPVVGWTLSEWDNMTPYYVGLGVAGAAWLYSIIDSPKAARRANLSRGIAINESIRISPDRIGTNIFNEGYGLSLKANF